MDPLHWLIFAFVLVVLAYFFLRVWIGARTRKKAKRPSHFAKGELDAGEDDEEEGNAA